MPQIAANGVTLHCEDHGDPADDSAALLDMRADLLGLWAACECTESWDELDAPSPIKDWDESRGLHFALDYPRTDPAVGNTVLVP